jgi:hypothetical protein
MSIFSAYSIKKVNRCEKQYRPKIKKLYFSLEGISRGAPISLCQDNNIRLIVNKQEPRVTYYVIMLPNGTFQLIQQAQKDKVPDNKIECFNEQSAPDNAMCSHSV